MEKKLKAVTMTIMTAVLGLAGYGGGKDMNDPINDAEMRQR